jgi:hypothetical protein
MVEERKESGNDQTAEKRGVYSVLVTLLHRTLEFGAQTAVGAKFNIHPKTVAKQ